MFFGGKMKKAIFPPDAQRSGIDVVYIQRRRTLRISGWYDSFVGIEPTEITLRDFFERLNITLKDCQSAFRVTDSKEGGK